MKKEILLRETQTTQVKLLTMELLSDGKEHTRREIIDYIEKQRKAYQMPQFRQGHFNGGIRQAINTLNCEIIRTGTYQAHIEMTEESLSERLSRCCENFTNDISQIVGEINILEATDSQMKILQEVRQCLKSIHKLNEFLENINE